MSSSAALDGDEVSYVNFAPAASSASSSREDVRLAVGGEGFYSIAFSSAEEHVLESDQGATPLKQRGSHHHERGEKQNTSGTLAASAQGYVFFGVSWLFSFFRFCWPFPPGWTLGVVVTVTAGQGRSSLKVCAPATLPSRLTPKQVTTLFYITCSSCSRVEKLPSNTHSLTLLCLSRQVFPAHPK